MIEVAEIFRRYGPAYREKYGQRMPPHHRQAMAAIERCRTEALGGHIYYCDTCDEARYSYHSCKNRHCPKCQHEAAQHWLLQQQEVLLPVPHFMVTFTLPAELRPLARRHPQTLYNLLFRASAAALQQLAADPRFVGGQIGLIGVLHTWTRDLRYHPHVHYLVPGGGLAADGQTWRPAKNAFLVHVKPLAKLFRAKFRDELKKTDLFDLVPAGTWSKDWVAHCKPVDSGQTALKYLANYVFRVALTNKRLVQVADDQVTFRYTEAKTGQTQYCTLPAETFIWRFLQHVLPKGFVKVRYYGLFSPGKRARLPQVQHLLSDQAAPQPTAEDQVPPLTTAQPAPKTAPQTPSVRCPKCRQPMQVVGTLQAKRCRSP